MQLGKGGFDNLPQACNPMPQFRPWTRFFAGFGTAISLGGSNDIGSLRSPNSVQFLTLETRIGQVEGARRQRVSDRRQFWNTARSCVQEIRGQRLILDRSRSETKSGK